MKEADVDVGFTRYLNTIQVWHYVAPPPPLALRLIPRALRDTGHGPVSSVRLVCAGPDRAGS